MNFFNNRGNSSPPPMILRPNPRRRKNPEFTKEMFFVYMPAMQMFVESTQGAAVFNEYKKIANSRCHKAVWGDEWEEGMSLLIAHFLVLWAERAATADRSMAKTVAGIAAMGKPKGVITSLSAGELSKSWDFGLTTLPVEKENAFYHRTDYGMDYYARLVAKRGPSMMSIT